MNFSRKPFIVAELSGNHKGDLLRARKLIYCAFLAGADAVKLQTYTPDSLTLDTHEVMQTGTWAGRTLHELYQEAATPWEWHKELFDFARRLGLVCFSSPFSEAAVDALETLDCPIYKIASPEITHLSLIHKAASTGKPMIISTGMATRDEIAAAVDCARAAGAGDITLLRCISAYPAPPESFNLVTMADIRDTFACDVGLSDHSLGHTVAVASVALGAIMIEKHLALSREGGSPDAAFSLEPREFEAMVGACRAAYKAMGNVVYGPTEAEKMSLQYRRSIWVAQDIRKGEKLTEENLRVLRPSGGIEPSYLPELIGKCANRDLARGTAMQQEYVA